jgi:putative ABC transport system substrate-binding protein
LVERRVDIIVTRGTPAALAAKAATSTIPIVMASSGDPVQAGIVASLARPGSNITGLSAIATDIQGKLLEMMREVVPALVRVAYVFNMANPVLQAQWREADGAAGAAGLAAQLCDVRDIGRLRDALDAAEVQRAQAVIVGIDALTQANRQSIASELLRRRLPSVGREREFVEAGGLLSYGIHYAESYHRAAWYVDRILRGAQPADLPVEQPTRLELVINLVTARKLGLAIPSTVLVRADDLIR